MICGARVALGFAGGYFLGRTKKMKLALMLAGMAAGRRGGGASGLLAQGSKLLSASPELSRLTDEVRGRLLQAGKGAALAVAARQVESLTDRVGKRVESLGSVGAGGGGAPRRAEEAEAADEYEPEAQERAGAADDDGAGGVAEEPEPRQVPRPRRRQDVSAGRERGAARRSATKAGGARRAADRVPAGRGAQRSGGDG